MAMVFHVLQSGCVLSKVLAAKHCGEFEQHQTEASAHTVVLAESVPFKMLKRILKAR